MKHTDIQITLKNDKIALYFLEEYKSANKKEKIPVLCLGGFSQVIYDPIFLDERLDGFLKYSFRDEKVIDYLFECYKEFGCPKEHMLEMVFESIEADPLKLIIGNQNLLKLATTSLSEAGSDYILNLKESEILYKAMEKEPEMDHQIHKLAKHLSRTVLKSIKKESPIFYDVLSGVLTNDKYSSEKINNLLENKKMEVSDFKKEILYDIDRNAYDFEKFTIMHHITNKNYFSNQHQEKNNKEKETLFQFFFSSDLANYKYDELKEQSILLQRYLNYAKENTTIKPDIVLRDLFSFKNIPGILLKDHSLQDAILAMVKKSPEAAEKLFLSGDISLKPQSDIMTSSSSTAVINLFSKILDANHNVGQAFGEIILENLNDEMQAVVEQKMMKKTVAKKAARKIL